ncbi:MAG: glucose-6-phosphate dehydrogenase [Candidatus Hydrogenedentes bacterium]|nr:glucose-6-phosphate dehydrogenase [Candidatus Hydrogenedentota bacterium]
MAAQPKAVFHGEATPADHARYRVGPEQMATVVIFGATGDLAGRKLVPALFNLWAADFLPKRLAVVGVARRSKSDDNYRSEMCEALKKFSRTVRGLGETCDPFISNLSYCPLDFSDHRGFADLGRRLGEIEAAAGLPGHRLYYLATSPEYFAAIIEQLGKAGLIHARGASQWTRVVVEKPFGHDLDSALALNSQIRAVLAEEQVYRIDHYLGKDTVQNIFAFRFGNAIFEPLFNQNYVNHVQITVAETIGMEERRGEFYDKTGALRDVVQNHALQLLCLVAMEPPAAFAPKEIRDEKVKVLSSVSVPRQDRLETWLVRGQYTEGPNVKGYLSEAGVSPNSTTETYVAVRATIENWRWAGVPFFVRTGKRLKERVTEIVVQFKEPPTHYFRKLGLETLPTNVLVFRIQPDEAIALTFNAKPPGMEFQVEPVDMDFDYGQAFNEALPDAYERLLLDALRGDSSLFTRADEVENAWRIIGEIEEASKLPPELYRPGTWGPTAASRLFARCRGDWRNP